MPEYVTALVLSLTMRVRRASNVVQTAVRKMLTGLLYRSRRLSPVNGVGPSDDAAPFMKVAVIPASNLLLQKHCFKNQPRPPEKSYYFLSAELAVLAPDTPLELRVSYAADDNALECMRK